MLNMDSNRMDRIDRIKTILDLRFEISNLLSEFCFYPVYPVHPY
jgi:hypothetical protein